MYCTIIYFSDTIHYPLVLEIKKTNIFFKFTFQAFWVCKMSVDIFLRRALAFSALIFYSFKIFCDFHQKTVEIACEGMIIFFFPNTSMYFVTNKEQYNKSPIDNLYGIRSVGLVWFTLVPLFFWSRKKFWVDAGSAKS